jgi:hypothetical protein
VKSLLKLVQVYDRICHHEPIISERSLPMKGMRCMDQRGVAKRIAILIASSILILLFFVCIPVVSAYVHNKTVLHAYRVINSKEQATQTVDATVTALNKEKLV